MTDQSQLENKIRDHCRRRQHAARTTPEFDEKVLRSVLNAQRQNQQQRSAPAEMGTRRFLMQGRKTQLAAAAIVIAVVVLGVSVFDDSPKPAYAVGQTIDAIKRIETVYMKGEFYKQGPFECWMRFDGDTNRPSHVWLGSATHNLCKICSPEGVFGLNRRTHRVHYASRDERGKSWIPKFSRFFLDAIQQTGTENTIQIGEDVITIRINAPHRQQEFVVDAQTKRPIRFTTIREDDPMEMMRQTLAVKHLTEIRYNEQPPAGLFDKPADAVVVQQEVDCMVDPDSGLVADGMTREQACLAIAKQAGQALVDLDQAALCKLNLFYRLYPPSIWEQIRKVKEAGQWVSEVTITGAPYRENDLWYVPVEVRSKTRQTEIQNAMIKFYELEGKTLCFIIGSKEKGVVD
ncbi:MAG: hypothetical protein JW955_18805 [Sedimentisphaerales bacterium]|nr:hypothetical protein [Sedimentisphaerales bacterium]